MNSTLRLFKKVLVVCTVSGLLGACSHTSVISINPAIPEFQAQSESLSPHQASQSVEDFDLLHVSDDMQAFVDPLIPTTMSKKQKAYMLNTLLRGAGFLNLEYEVGDTFTAEQAFIQQSANCVGFSNLFVALARHYGLKARFQIVRKYPEWHLQDQDEDGQVMSLSIHINTVLTFPDGKQFVVDVVPRKTERYRLRNPYYHMQLALDAERQKDINQAIKHINKAIRIKKNEPEFHELKVKLLEMSAGEHAANKKHSAGLGQTVNLSKGYVLPADAIAKK